MNISSSRQIEPAQVSASVSFDDADVVAAFYAQATPDEDLFYKVFSPAYNSLKVSEKLALLSQIAALAEAVPPPAPPV